MIGLKEDFLQFVWQHKLLKPRPLITSTNKEIFILKPGELNKDAGPDFFNAQIKTGNIILAGNIEVHIKTSDWLKHNHQNDKSYDNIILHVVYENDTSLPQNINNNVEVLEIKNLLPLEMIEQYESLITAKQEIACNKQLHAISDIKFSAWLQRMFVERLESKVKYIETVFTNCHGDYSQTFYTLLLRNFGFKVNALPFELLAKQLPVHLLLKHADNLTQLEALLIGTSGLLDQQFDKKHVLNLQNEFEYLKTKYRITPLNKELFKFSKLRPANFATLRLAQFANIIYRQSALFSAPHNFNTYAKIKNCFNVTMDGFWKNHYNLNGNEVEKDLQIGETSITNIIINTFSTFFFFYYKRTGKTEYEKIPFELMESCAFEKNAKTRLFDNKKPALKSAIESQGILNLYYNYCTKRKCLSCSIGVSLLKSV